MACSTSIRRQFTWRESVWRGRQHPPTSLFHEKLCCGLLNLTSSYFFLLLFFSCAFNEKWLKSICQTKKILLINYWLLVCRCCCCCCCAATSRIRHAKYNATTITKEHFSTLLFCLHQFAQVNCNFLIAEQKKLSLSLAAGVCEWHAYASLPNALSRMVYKYEPEINSSIWYYYTRNFHRFSFYSSFISGELFRGLMLMLLLMLLQLFIILNVKTIIFGDLNEYRRSHKTRCSCSLSHSQQRLIYRCYCCWFCFAFKIFNWRI